VGVRRRDSSRIDEVYRPDARRDGLRDLFVLLNEAPETLVVLNHPLWDIEFIGAERHQACLMDFLAEHGEWIHAFEINGFRSWREHRMVMMLAEDLGYPVVTGGDRNGCQANTVLNLTRATRFADFVAEIREVDAANAGNTPATSAAAGAGGRRSKHRDE
jgi:hypothetical protein